MNSVEIMKYDPPLKRKKNEDISSYKLRKLDYWLKHTHRVKKPWYIRWFSKEKYLLIWK